MMIMKKKLAVFFQTIDQLPSDEESYTVQVFPESARVDDISRLLGSILKRKPTGGSETNVSNSTQSDVLLQKLK
jgi:hypothetical protein